MLSNDLGIFRISLAVDLTVGRHRKVNGAPASATRSPPNMLKSALTPNRNYPDYRAKVRRAENRGQVMFTQHLDFGGIRPLIGTVADAADNSLMETVVGLFKTECIRTTVSITRPTET